MTTEYGVFQRAKSKNIRCRKFSENSTRCVSEYSMVFVSILYHAEHHIALFFVTKNQFLSIGRRNGSHSKHAMENDKINDKTNLGFPKNCRKPTK